MSHLFKIGDKVDFVNEFGVIFEGRTITGCYIEDENKVYSIEPDDCPWIKTKEVNLHLAGTYKKLCQNIVLNNGIVAEFHGYDDWYNKIFIIENKRVVFMDGQFYGERGRFDEAYFPLMEEYQPDKSIKL